MATPDLQVVPFQRGQLYNRRKDIHASFSGQTQGGISTPANSSFIFLFTGESGKLYGYKDGWDENGVFIYTGEGQVGDMKFTNGNKAVRDHVANAKQLLLFHSLGKQKPVRFLGEFESTSWEYRRGRDKNDELRQTIAFHLIPQDEGVELPLEPSQAGKKTDLLDLREQAYLASAASAQATAKQAKKILYSRSEVVRDYVLARASGKCELCAKPAPFSRPDKTPYLEPHHTRRVADGGPDHPRWVGALCPNCHREIHSGANGKALNDSLIAHIGKLELSNVGAKSGPK